MKKQFKDALITRTDRETGTIEILSLLEAKIYLSGCWHEDKIEPMLLGGEELWTPYATFSLFTNP